jgi:hypothetical protein
MIVAQIQAREREMEIAEQQRRRQQQSTSTEHSHGDAHGNPSDNNYSTNRANARAALHAMPDAYRTADAAVYAVMDFDEGVDDDYHDEVIEHDLDRYHQVHRTSDLSAGRVSSTDQSSTVKAFLIAGCTISFGSVAR